MCGIAGGAWTSQGQPLDEMTVRRMTDVIQHRGPDDEGFYDSRTVARLPGLAGGAGAALGFRRLAIIDLTTGHQPMSNEDGSVWIVFNGEIYNFQDLQHRLQGAGHVIRSRSDTETLVHLYEDEGMDFLKHVDGMFALAIWDGNTGQLILARDRLGEKPLYYQMQGERILFGSELKCLLQVEGVERRINLNAIDAYLAYQYVPHPDTIFQNIHKLPPGHLAVFRHGNLKIQPYWQIDGNREEPGTAEEYRERLRAAMTHSVRTRMISDVPLGAFLSGGIDSSIVVGLMSKLHKQPVKTFSIGFPVAEYNETQYAREVAQRLGTDHHEFQVEPDGVAILPRLVWHYDEPFADSSAIPTWYVSQFTRKQVTVALTGDGGDELFAGYPRYRAVKLAGWIDRLPAPLRYLTAGKFWQRLPASPRQKSRLRQWKRFAAALADTPQRRYFDWVSIFNEARRAEIYSADFVSQLADSDPFSFLRSAFARSARRDVVTATSLADLQTYLPCDLMYKVDIASMAHSLECRQPFLDHHVVELAAAMPIALKMRGLKGKTILKETFADLLPVSVQKRAKMGFGVPLDHWFRHELKQLAMDVLTDSRCLNRGYFREDAVRKLLDEHLESRFDHAYRLWSLLVLELWHRQWVDQQDQVQEPASRTVITIPSGQSNEDP